MKKSIVKGLRLAFRKKVGRTPVKGEVRILKKMYLRMKKGVA